MRFHSAKRKEGYNESDTNGQKKYRFNENHGWLDVKAEKNVLIAGIIDLVCLERPLNVPKRPASCSSASFGRFL